MTHALNISIESLPWALLSLIILLLYLISRRCRRGLYSSSKSHVGLAMWRNTTTHSATEGCSCDSNYTLSQTSQQLNSAYELGISVAVPIIRRCHTYSRKNHQWYDKKGSNDAQDHERCYRAIRWSLWGHQPYSSGNGEKESCPKASSNEGYASFIGK